MALAGGAGLSRAAGHSNLYAVLAARLRHRATQRDRLGDLHRHRQYCPMADGAEKAGVAPGEQIDTWSGASHCNAGCFFERFGLIFLTEVARISAQNIIFDASSHQKW